MKFALIPAVVLLLAAGALSAQTYAYSPYSTSYPGIGMSNVEIKRGTTTLLTNSSTGSPQNPWNYDYTGIASAYMIPGSVHTIHCTMGTYNCCMSCTAWIDYDNNGVFDDNTERIGYTASGLTAGAVGVISFTPPTGVGGALRLRIRHVYATAPPHDAYAVYSYGEAEDYSVNFGFAISTASPLPTGALGIAYQTDIVAVNGVTPYTWQGSPSYAVSGSLPAGLSASPLGNNLRISGTPTGTGTSNFTVSVNDNSGTPQNAMKQFSITIVPTPTTLPFSDDFSTDKGWQAPAPWSRGVASAFVQSTAPYCSEPGSDHSPSADNMILGDTIGGLYAANDANVYWAVSPMMNCSSASSVRLRFWRWLGLAIGSTAKIEVTNNGTNWVSVWTSISGVTYGGTTNPVWDSVFYDITAVAAGNATVQVRFGIGPTGTTALTGWCIDDLLIEEPTDDMEVRETGSTGPVITDGQAAGGGRDFGTIYVSQQSAPLTIYITNNGPSNITFGTLTKTGAQPSDFYINASSMQNPLPVGQSTLFTIIFYRTTAGVSTATINLPHSAAYSGSSPFEINVTGEAIVPQPLIRMNLGGATGPQITHQQSPAGTPRDFGNQDISAGPTTAITIFITNAGTGTLAISTPSMGGVWWTEYVVNSTGMVSQLPAGQSTSFTVAFDPASVGPKDAYVQIPHTDGTQVSPFYIAVTGQGTMVVATELRVTTQPTDSAKAQILSTTPVVAITDAAGTVAMGDNSTQVQVAITASTGNSSATLGGTLTVTAVGGIVTFPDLEISHSGNGYTLTFTDITGPLGTVESDPFNITGGGGNGGDDDEEEESCSTGAGSGAQWPALLVVFALVLAWRRGFRARRA